MRRIIDNYLQLYADKLCYRLWQYEWYNLLKPEVIERLKTRRGFLHPIVVENAFAGPSSFSLILRDPKVSVLHKLILLTGLNKFSAHASAKALYYSVLSAVEYTVGEYRLTDLEVLSLCQVILKKYYSVNIDMCRYLKHLSIFIPFGYFLICFLPKISVPFGMFSFLPLDYRPETETTARTPRLMPYS